MENQELFNKQSSKVDNTILFENVDPNKEYSILYIGSGKDNSILEMGEELITDGDIANMTHRYKEDSDIYRTGSLVVEIKNASYAILQRLSDKKVDYVQIFTDIEEDSKLQEIVNLANVKHLNRGELLTTKHPYVRKIVLK